MKITFVSNYINHHQIPFCEEIISLLGEEGSFTFIQTDEMEKDRRQMGWEVELPSYVLSSYESPENEEKCRQLLMDSEVVIFGGSSDDSLIIPRLEKQRLSGDFKKKVTFRYSERVYKEGQWKFITPRGLRKKYLDHTRYNKLPVYLLSAGGYVASDYALFGAYKNKKLKWGYFPPFKEIDADKVIGNKGYEINGKKVPYILWAGRLLELKHPELAVLTAKYLSEKGYEFHMDIVGDGPEKEKIKSMVSSLGLSNCVSIHGFMSPGEIRSCMEKADIYLFTSNRIEGWGAVVNESMNSACALLSGSMIGSVPFLVENGKNGFVYLDGDRQDLLKKAEKLLLDKNLREEMGKRAYETIRDKWNSKVAAERLFSVSKSIIEGEKLPHFDDGPCSIDIPMGEKKISKRAAGRTH